MIKNLYDANMEALKRADGIARDLVQDGLPDLPDVDEKTWQWMAKSPGGLYKFASDVVGPNRAVQVGAQFARRMERKFNGG